MGRKQTITIDRVKLLAGIASAYSEELAYERTRDTWPYANAEIANIQSFGVRIDFERFLDMPLTASQRIRCQQELRRMEAAGLVSIYGDRATRALLTGDGRSALEAKS